MTPGSYNESWLDASSLAQLPQSVARIACSAGLESELVSLIGAVVGRVFEACLGCKLRAMSCE